MNKPAIVVDQLVKRYGPVTAVDHVSFSVETGEIFGLLGPNGAGKTSTLEILVGLSKPDSGTVRIFGLDSQRQRSQIAERLGVQFQTTALPKHLTVAEVLALFASFYRRHLPVNDVLAMFGLAEKRRSLTSKLSGGQQQRLALALAFLNDPDVLILDEPSVGLDPQSRHLLWQRIREWRQHGRTVVLATHQLQEAEALCDRVAIIDHGRIIALDRPAELARRSRREEAVWVQIEGDDVPPALERLPGVVRLHRDDDGMLLYSSDISETLNALLTLRRNGIAGIGAIQVRPPSLEDVFLTLTGRELRE